MNNSSPNITPGRQTVRFWIGRLAVVACVWPFALAIMSAVGCVNVNSSVKTSDTSQQMAPVDDGRPIAQLRDENARLRTERQGLEKENAQLRATMDQEKRNLKDAEANRDAIKKDRDRYRKMAKGNGDD